MAEMETVFCLGSNYGNRHAYMSEAIDRLKRILSDVVCSPIYETPAIGGSHLPPYLNAIVKGCSSLSLEDLNLAAKRIEIEMGRDSERRSKGEVPMDIDVVMYGDEIVRPQDYARSYFRIGYDLIQK